ncbi:MAG: LptF/LptG family permease [Campylobacterales bacterium]
MKSRLLSGYLLHHFAGSFFPLFGALFLIASVVAFVQLAAMTSAIKMSFGEMLLLYTTHIPTILLYTMPITFFASLTVALAKLSFDLELIVLFSLKTSVFRIMRPFFALATILTIVMLLVGLVLKPKAYFLQRAMIYSKQDDAQINIRASEFGQRFGDWLLFVGQQTSEDSYREVVMFSKESDARSGYFVGAQRAIVENNEGLLSFILFDGSAYQTTEQQITQVDFEQMRLNEPGRLRALDYQGLKAYWIDGFDERRTKREFIWTALASFFVLLCLPAAAAFGIHNPRFEKNRASAWALGMTLLFYVPGFLLGDKASLYAFAIIPLWLTLSLYFYRRRVGRTF